MSKSKFRQRTRVLSGREARRYGEREREREQRKADAERFWQLPPEERARRLADSELAQRIQKNGITLEDVKRAEDKSYAQGMQAGIENTMKTCYAAICLALNELHGFGRKRCKEVLNAVDEKVVMTLTSEDIIQEVFDRMGLVIRFNAGPLEERIEETED
jgi:hypothetical protein